MGIEAGSQLLHYRLTEKVGEGGMGAVWKATDTTLGRDVAVKFLPQLFVDDPERRARFEREAKLLASLNHPNVAAVYGLHEDQGVYFLVMELVAGEDLQAHLQRGALSVERTLDIAAQMASGIEAAHDNGVIHRDLKPANVIVTPEGRVKLLDFGLAKGFERDPGSNDPSMSPTMTSAGTVAGMILGTAAYMSPEQARGKPVDRRTDLWSFGCVVYECLTGVRLFEGDTVSDSLAAILRKDPDWSLLPEATPPLVRLMLRRCLARDLGKRLRDAGDARLELEQAVEDPRVETPSPGAPSRRAAWLPWVLAAVATLLAVYFGLMGGGDEPPQRTARRFTVTVPMTTQFGDNLASPPAVSPDGRFIVFGAGERDNQLWLRSIDNFEARPLSGTHGAEYAFWSPDSRHIGFFLKGQLRRVEVATGRVQPVGGEGSSYSRGGSWGTGGRIVFAPNANAGIHLIDAAGGELEQITTPDPDMPDGSHRWPHFLPDGKHFLFLAWTNDPVAREHYGGVFVASIDGGTEPRRVIADASSVAYAPSGHILVCREENLIAIPFDANALRVSGEAQVVATGVLQNRASGHSAFSVSNSGTLVYARGQAFPPASLDWIARSGTTTETTLEDAPYAWLRLSPDSQRAAVTIFGATGDEEIWTIDLRRGVRTLLATAAWTYNQPIWSGDGRQLLFVTLESGSSDLYTRPSDGSGQQTPVLVDGSDKVLFDWSLDGRDVIYWPIGSGRGTADLWIHDTTSGESEPFVSGDASYQDARFSPDGRHVAYASDDSGQSEVFVQTRATGARLQVSTAGGEAPRWRDDGGEIVYLDPEQRMIAVSVEAGSEALLLGPPEVLFTIDDVVVTYDATADHRRFLIATRTDAATEPLHVVLDWDAQP